MSAPPPAARGDAETWRRPPPHFKPDPRYQRQPQSAEEWDGHADPVGEHAFRAKRRLAFAGDLADPRAPEGMALVSRWDVSTVLMRLSWLEARFENTRSTALASSATQEDGENGAWISDDDLRAEISSAYAQGAQDAHDHWRADRDPDFTEAADEYAREAVATTPRLSPPGGDTPGQDAEGAKKPSASDVGIGMMIAAAIVASDFDNPVIAAEILGAAGVKTRADADAFGTDPYDLDRLDCMFTPTQEPHDD